MSAAPTIDPAIEEAGRKILKAFDVRERFFHIELFQTTTDGRIIALEVNMRPPGAWMTDAMNYTYDIDVYADLGQHGGQGRGRRALRRANISPPMPAARTASPIAMTMQAVLAAHGDKIVHHQPIEKVFSKAMGNYAYQMRSKDRAALRAAVDFIHAEEA